MTATNANAPIFQANATDGTPAAGYLIYTYAAGTSTPVTTYQNYAASVTNTNPIVLDAYGMAKIWITVNTKLVMKTPDDLTTVFTMDNLVPNDLDIIDGNGNYLIKFTSTPNAVNYFNVTNASTGTAPILESAGTDTNVDFKLRAKGTGKMLVGPSTSAGVVLEGTQPLMDANSNELIKFTATAAAVNEFTIANAATAGGPILSATGGDTNIDINITPKGTGNIKLNGDVDITGDINVAGPIVTIPGNATEAAELRLKEDTDNGTNYVGLKAAAAIAADLTFVLPSADGAANSIMVTDGAKNLSFATKSGLTIASSGANTDITSVYLDNTGLKIKDTNASHGLSIVPGSDLTLDRTLTVTTGDANRTLTLSGDLTVAATGTAVLTSRTLTAAGLVTGGGDLSADRTVTVTAAVQADMETGTSTTTAVTPGVVKYHPSAAKAWVLFNDSGAATISVSYNVSSVSDNGTGDYTVNFTTAFSSTDYPMSASSQSAGLLGPKVSGTRTASAFQVINIVSNTLAATDVQRASCIFFGDQ